MPGLGRIYLPAEDLRLIAIYSRLLERIEATNYDVFSRRVRLSSLEKSWILVQALLSNRAAGATR